MSSDKKEQEFEQKDHNVQGRSELESGYNDEIATSQVLEAKVVCPVEVVTSSIQLLPSSEQVKMLNVVVTNEVNPIPKPQRTFSTPDGSQNSLIDNSKTIAKNNLTIPEVSVELEHVAVNMDVVNNSKAESETESKRERKPLMFKQKAEFIPPPFPSPQTPRTSSRAGKNLEVFFEEEFITTAYLALFFVCFNILWSIGLVFWHSKTDKFWECVATTAIILISSIIVGISFFCNPRIPKISVWKSSKLVSLLSVIPCLLPIILASANTIFTIKESRNRNYERPLINTLSVFLVESLCLAFPQCVLQLCILMEDPDSIPSAKGFFMLAGVFVMSHAVVFSRIRYDSLTKPDFMEHGINKMMRYTIFWSHKVLWTVTLACVIVSFRLCFKSNKLLATVGGICLLLFIYEVPVILSTVKCLSGYFSGNADDFFFLLPQFISLSFLIFWINMDTNIYHTNIGSVVLGAYFWTEMIIITAWVNASAKETVDSDFITMYPHFFGSLVAEFK